MNHLVREAYAAVRELVENAASEKVGRTLADIRERFDGAAAIFGYPMFELEKESRRAQSVAVALRTEYATKLTAAREEFAREVSEASSQLSEARTESARELTEARTELARELAETRREFAIRVSEAREEFAVRLGETQSECQRLANEANQNVARAEDIVAYVGHRMSVEAPSSHGFATIYGPVEKNGRN